MGAKEKLALKFVSYWSKCGYDVLEINTPVSDILFPKPGAEYTAQRVRDFLDMRNQPVIVHGMSAGCQVYQRVLMVQRDTCFRITHQILENPTFPCVPIQAFESGLKGIFEDPKHEAIACKVFRMFSKYWNHDTFLEARDFLEKSPYKAPTLYMHSMADKMSQYGDLVNLIQSQEKVAPVEKVIIDETKRVPHMGISKWFGENVYMGFISNFIAKYPSLK